MKIYLAHQISGLSGDEVFSYYDETENTLSPYFQVLSPMKGKESFRTEVKYAPQGYSNPIATDKAIVSRDHWMVKQADIVYANLIGTTNASIGMCFEMAWAYTNGKLVVVAIEPGNVHEHAFVMQCAGLVFNSHEEAMENIKLLGDKNGR
jgi:nucleoside 2-deoxyribosyltransferase